MPQKRWPRTPTSTKTRIFFSTLPVWTSITTTMNKKTTPRQIHFDAHHVQEQEISGIAENETAAALANDTDVDENADFDNDGDDDE